MKILRFMDYSEYPTQEGFELERDYTRLQLNVISRTTEEHEAFLNQFLKELETITIVTA